MNFFKTEQEKRVITVDIYFLQPFYPKFVLFASISRPKSLRDIFLGRIGTSVGWKTPQDGLDTWHSFKFDEHCAKLNTTSFEACVEEDTFNLTDVVRGVHYSSNNSSSFFWTQDLTATNMGKHHTLKSGKALLTSTPDDMLITHLGLNLSFAVFVHDENFFVTNMNPLGPPSNMQFFKPPFKNFYLDKSCKM